jgi:hypothetical protein
MSNSKTPQFDKSLEEILANLKPHQRICQQCGRVFDISQEDIEFYKKLQVPPPKLCPDCRKQRRFGFYNNILKFYKKEDARTGEKIISTFPPESLYKIYDLKYWWSDNWGGEDYYRDYDSSKPFFEQFQELNLTIPHQALLCYQKGLVESPYTIDVVYAKNCYLSALSLELENVHYSYWTVGCKDSMDLLHVSYSENCYECITAEKCYKCFFCQNCCQCIDSYFLYDCRDCSNCFGCFNLRHKSYCFFNEQLTKEEYQEKMRQINLGDRNVLLEQKEKFEKFLVNAIRKSVTVDRKNINCLGDYLYMAKNCYQVFRSGGGVEDIRYSTDCINNVKDCMDAWIVGPDVFFSYEVVSVLNSNNIKFSYAIRDSLDLEYCLECFDCQHCFGCIGLRKKNYHIFNKPYSEEDYWQKLDEIKTKMLKDGEYGEFFPLSMSLHPYNDTYAMVEFPLPKEEVLKRGWKWYDEPKMPPDLKGLEPLEAKDIPKDIKDVKDDILDKAIFCEITGRPFRIIKSELDFYRKHNLPIPTKHPYQRMLERFQKRNPSKLWKTTCAKCKNQIFTSYPPEKQRELKIYCQECYLKEVV